MAVLGLTSLVALIGVVSMQGSAQAAPAAHSTASSVKGANYNNYTTPDASYYNCGTYNLSGWVTRDGSYIDNQTGSPVSTFWSGYNGTGGAPARFQPFSYSADYNFYPVNSITVC